ncbi:alkaline shock response membrane anchor protein AmaP [Paenibacillus oenotherae]|uniref:Alkaline shock response membrane anchor protein AmaP n=1 Tax=Paenibacillus oenotherae TaxID=1435645 RepID=A0ABS7D0Z6_9BACL|nr:alkaline shock response membrane anchor protein AmaP [Paenibacillus oenotherae]MBW7473550.1 alkaline shock response membrane anchor protein AmaP [Paenibacillus oenotherae]
MIRVMDKLLLFLLSLAVGALSVLAFGIGLNWIPEEWSREIVQDLYSGKVEWLQWTVVAVSVVMFLIGLRFFYVSLRRSNSSAPSIDQRTEFGDIRISIETVENLALKAAGRQRGIKDLRARIRISEAGIDISLRAVADGESSIPVLTEEIQRAVKSHVEEITGIPVATVAVFVANIIQSTNFKSRVE